MVAGYEGPVDAPGGDIAAVERTILKMENGGSSHFCDDSNNSFRQHHQDPSILGDSLLPLSSALHDACEVINDVLLQLALKDSPPSNDIEDRNEGIVSLTAPRTAIPSLTKSMLAQASKSSSLSHPLMKSKNSMSSSATHNSEKKNQQSMSTIHLDGIDSAHAADGTPTSVVSVHTEETESTKEISAFFQENLREALTGAEDEIVHKDDSSSAPTSVAICDDHPAQQYQKHYHNQKKALSTEQALSSQEKMGHGALVALCSWTVEQVQKKNGNSTNIVGLEQTPLTSTVNTLQHVQDEGSSLSQQKQMKPNETIPAASVPDLEGEVVSECNNLLANSNNMAVRTIGHGQKLSPITAATGVLAGGCRFDFSTTDKNEILSTSGSPLISNGVNLGENESTSPSINNDSTSTRPSIRLQMFGSEYARHLSTCHLAPVQQSVAAIGGGNSNSYKTNAVTKVVSLRSMIPRHSSVRLKQHLKRQHRNIEEAHSSIVTGAIVDICACYGEELPPRGFYRISKTATGRPFSLQNSSSSASASKKKSLHLYVKKEPDWDKSVQRSCVTALTIIFPDRQEFVPPGFCIVRQFNKSNKHSSSSSDRMPADLNHGLSGDAERIYLCFRRSRDGNPLTGILPLCPGQAECIPEGYTVVEKSPRNFCADIRSGSGKSPMFLAYRQRLANLEALRPLPLILSVYNSPTDTAVKDDGAETNPKKRLSAYYCTGGSVVPANVGRFHILDRSTHEMLCPSSVSNRLLLIKQSRLQNINNSKAVTMDNHEVTADTTVSATTSDSIVEGSLILDDHNTEASLSVVTDHIEGDTGSVTERSLYDSMRSTTELSSVTDIQHEESPLCNLSSLMHVAPFDENGKNTISQAPDTLFVQDASLKACIESMDFIPSVEIPSTQREVLKSLRLPVRTALLTPLLTVCYTRHGGGALVAVEGLTALLTMTDFFEDDVNLTTGSDESISRLTLLDLSIQVVCDVATIGTQETAFGICVEFVENALRYARGQLSARTIGYVSRFYHFVFYFGASIPSSNAQWPNPSWNSNAPSDHGNVVDGDHFSILHDPRSKTESQVYLPGGAPQYAALSFKELISLSIVRLGKVSVDDLIDTRNLNEGQCSLMSDGTTVPEGGSPPSSIGDMLSSLINASVDHAERANHAQLALQQIYRSDGSELFWHDMVNECGRSLFGGDKTTGQAAIDMYILSFTMMAYLVKASSGRLKTCVDTTELVSRDIASKLLSLELLLHFLEYWSDEQEALHGIEFSSVDLNAKTIGSIETLSFTMRRMVVPCLFSNTRASLENPQVFCRVIRIISELWCSPIHRNKCKAELGVLIEHFALRILQLGPQFISTEQVDLNSRQAHVSLLSQQISVLKEVKKWFANNPEDVIELYLNFDTDILSHVPGSTQLLPGSQCKLFQRLCSNLSNIAEKCGELIGNQIQLNQSMIRKHKEKDNECLLEAQEFMDEGSTSLVNKSSLREAARILRKTSLEAISQIVRSLAISAAASAGRRFLSLILSWSPSSYSLDECERSYLLKSSGKSEEVSHGFQPCQKAFRSQSCPIVNDQESPPSADREVLMETAFEIAEKKSLKKAVDYLVACNALTPAPRDISTFLRIHREQIDQSALGNYLGEGGTGGIETEYWNSIRHLYISAISFIGMNIEEGLRHFLTKCGFRLPGEAQKVDRILNTFAQCYYEENVGDTDRCPFNDQDTIYLLSFAIIMLNTDLHRCGAGARKQKKMTKAEFINNLRGAQNGEDIPRDYLSSIFDSIEAQPIALNDESLFDTSPTEGRHKDLQDMLNNVRIVDSLLRGLAIHDFKFATIKDYVTSIEFTGQDKLLDLTRSCVTKTWHQWHGVINTGLETAHLDPQGMEPSVEILLYALTITICLDMPTERAAFLSQLGRLKAFEERRQGNWGNIPEQESYNQDFWYVELERASAGNDNRKLWALQCIQEWMESLQSSLLVDVKNRYKMTENVDLLIDGDFLLEDPSRFFLRSGNLLKKSGRTGRLKDYRFFLFSDVLLYAKSEKDGQNNRYKIHEELSLHLMKIIDWFPSVQKSKQTTFEVHHPQKSFQVICASVDERKIWVNEIRAAIKEEIQTNMNIEAARVAANAAIIP